MIATLRHIIRQKSSQPVIPRKSNSTIGNNDMDWGLYKYRHLVENIFTRIKHSRAIATRYNKLSLYMTKKLCSDPFAL